jgi:hypothetical protein
MDDTLRFCLYVFPALAILLVGFAIAYRRCCPYRLCVVDKSRGIRKIAFSNPAYTALLIRRIGAADGLFANP